MAKTRSPARKPPPRPIISDKCQDLFDDGFRRAAAAGMEQEVMLWALHETFVLAREHPRWSKERVWREALFAALMEWDLV